MKELIRVRVQYASRQQCCKTHKRPLPLPFYLSSGMTPEPGGRTFLRIIGTTIKVQGFITRTTTVSVSLLLWLCERTVADVNVVMSTRTSVPLSPIGRIPLKFGTEDFNENLSRNTGHVPHSSQINCVVLCIVCV